jgi:hypothetical protein
MAPRKPVDDLPGLNTVSAPATSLQGAIAFAPRENALLDLSQSLKSVNRSLGEYGDRIIKEQNDAATAEGRQLAMLDDAKSYKEYVEKGGEPMASPWVVYGYKQQKGRVLGQSYQAFVSDKKLNWEGSGSDDIEGEALVNTLPKWRQEFLQQRGEIDSVEMAGFEAYANPEEDNMLRQHIAESRQVATDNMKTQVYNEFYNLLKAPGKGKEALFAQFDNIYSRQEFIGLRKDVGPLLLQAVTDYAVEQGDAKIVDMVKDYARKDAKTGQSISVLKNTKATAVLDKARNDAFRSSVTLDNARKSAEDDSRQTATREAVTKVIADIASGGKSVDAFKVANDAAAGGADAAQVLSAASSINNVLNNRTNDISKGMMTDIYSEIMSEGPSRTREQYLKEVTTFGDKEDLVAFDNLWTKYVEKGESVFSQYPELRDHLEMMNRSARDEETKNVQTRQMAQAVRNALKNKVPPENLPKEVKRQLAELQKEQAKFAKSFADVPASNLDQNGLPLPAGGIKAPAASKTSAVQLQPVASFTELAAMKGKSANVIDETLLKVKPVMSPLLMSLAVSQIRGGNIGPEATSLIRLMGTLGINTNDPKRALMELTKRGQGKFYPAMQSPQPTK